MFFWKRNQFPPPPPGLTDYMVTVHVVLTEPLEIRDFESDAGESSPAQVVGYYQNFGLRCAPSRLREVLTQAVEDGTIDWADTEIAEAPPFRKLRRRIRSRAAPVIGEGIWYLSGRALHGPDDSDETIE